jgi:Ca2+-binding RTX toxin-like protein
MVFDTEPNNIPSLASRGSTLSYTVPNGSGAESISGTVQAATPFQPAVDAIDYYVFATSADSLKVDYLFGPSSDILARGGVNGTIDHLEITPSAGSPLVLEVRVGSAAYGNQLGEIMGRAQTLYTEMNALYRTKLTQGVDDLTLLFDIQRLDFLRATTFKLYESDFVQRTGLEVRTELLSLIDQWTSGSEYLNRIEAFGSEWASVAYTWELPKYFYGTSTATLSPGSPSFNTIYFNASPTSGTALTDVTMAVSGYSLFYINNSSGSEAIDYFLTLSVDREDGGSNAADTITGYQTNDVFHGFGGNDFIVGNGGSDQLFGDLGDDILYGDTTKLAPLPGGTAFGSGTVTRLGSNNTLATATDISRGFSLAPDALIDYSTIIPHVTTGGLGDNTVHYYKFTIANQSRVTIDFDGADRVLPGTWFNFAESFSLFRADGGFLGRPQPQIGVDVGSVGQVDPLGQYVIDPGTYYIGVGRDVAGSGELGPVPTNGSYRFHVSIDGDLPVVDPFTGNDVLDGGAGADVLAGGDGLDTASYARNSVAVSVFLKSNYADEGGGVFDRLYNIENVTGSNFDDTIEGDASANVIVGGIGNDTVYYRSSAVGVTVNLIANVGSGGDATGDTYSSIENVIGSDIGTDVLIGNSQANFLSGSGGNDVLDGGDGGDSLFGGEGADWMKPGAGFDYAVGGNGTDTVDYSTSVTGVGVHLLFGGGFGGDAAGDGITGVENVLGSLTAADALYGDDAANVLMGQGGDDTLFGSGGADLMDGGTGSDTVYYFASVSQLVVNLATGSGIGGDAAGDTYSGIENVIGSNNFTVGDVLTGNSTNNFINGYGGGDLINGGLGNDTLYGGVNGDTFRFSDSLFGFDVIGDWEDGSDKISLAATVATSMVGVSLTKVSATSWFASIGGQGITVNSATAFTLDAGDFLFL